MKIIALIILLTTGLISFNASALVTVDNFTYTPEQCAARTPFDGAFPNYWESSNHTYTYYDGCEYIAKGLCLDFGDNSLYCTWYPTGRVQPSVTGTGSGPAGTGGGTGPVAPGTGSVPSGSGGGTDGSSGSGSGSGGTGGSPGSIPVFGGSGWSSGGSSGSGGTGGSSGGSSGSGGTGGSSGGDGGLNFNYGSDWGLHSTPGSKPGETNWTSTTPLPAPVPYGEPTAAEIKNYAKDFFVYNRQCGSSCLSYFNTTGGMFTPVTCQDLAFNLNVPHKKPDCRSDDIAWYDKAGNFIEFKYPLTDKARHDIINKLKQEFSPGSSGNAPFYPGVTPLPSGPVPVEVKNPVPNFFNVPSGFTSEHFKKYGQKDKPFIDFDGYRFIDADGNWNPYDGATPYELLSVIDSRLRYISEANNRTANSVIDLIYGGNGEIVSSIDSFHNDFNKRMSTDNLESTAKDSVSKLSANLTGLLNGQNVGGEFAEASRLMGQIGNGADSPLLGKFLEKNLIPTVDTHQCVMPVFGRGTQWEFTLSSDKWLKLKQILTFMMYAYTFWCLFEMLTNTGDRK
ncbi:hypothetical protein C8721_003777 [Salmonella enterica subsp. enterica serovar Berta]|nr:hypothetical protein [Salmonella enterica subsp. enterica serovar Berta]